MERWGQSLVGQLYLAIGGKCEGTHGGIYDEVARARDGTDNLYGKRARKVKSLIIV